MLDLKFILQNLPLVKENTKNRNMQVDFDAVIAMAQERSKLAQGIDAIRQKINISSGEFMRIKDQHKKQKVAQEVQSVRGELKNKESALRVLEAKLYDELYKIPNLTHPQSPVDVKETGSTVVATVGKPKKYAFPVKDHVTLGKELDILDFDRATAVAGNKFYYLKNEGALLELALIRYALDIVMKAGFTYYSTPDLAKLDVITGLGFNPRGHESQIYRLQDSDLGLVATAEITLGGLYKDATIPAEQLPLRLAGLSHCFRTEAGAYGKASKGLYRVHQFTKLEMFVFATPEQSEKMHEEIVSIEKQIFKGLGIPFRVIDICTGDLGAAAYRKYDIEAWIPSHDAYGEVTSASNCTDYQARRLKTKFESKDKKQKGFVHTLNGTAIAISRGLIALLETYQQKDGSIKIPTALQKYTGFTTIKPKLK